MSEVCRDLNKLNPNAKKAAEYLIEACKAENIDIIVTETFRTVERQQELYAQGRTKPGNIVTNADGVKYKSIHQSGNAFDICQNIRGKEYETSILKRAGELGQEIGLEWGGSWKDFVDMPHFQLNDGVIPKKITPKYEVKKTKLKLHGVIKEVDSILVDGFNHIKLRDLADKKITVHYEKGKIYINNVEFTGETILFNDTNYIKLRDLPKDMFCVCYEDNLPEVHMRY